MSSNTASTDTPTCPTLISPSNFQFWNLQIMEKLQREKVLGVALGTDTCPITSLSIPGTTTAAPVPATSPSVPGPSTVSPTLSGSPTISRTATAEEVQKWMEWNKRVHTTTWDLFDALLSIHQASNLASTFYIFQQLFNSTWSGGSTISKHILLLCTLEACPAGMRFMVNTRLLAFILLNSLLKTPEWNMFTSSVINTVEDSKLTFDTVETQITLEEARLNPSGPSDSTLKVSNKSSTHPPNSAAWCKHHQ
ncbi:hypothetical protein PAXRUDRAFT_16752 [Paxillus rubicundulus Ve08.2h10]|uniref:Uncharacterized protein n=1 Tax=Paxillus rubicundulus Ve08.2h10 TaxID=930991 RepID=A0A0D0C6C7_9AGAM|nr:hypothetical protein PAXRUDRAFT_16752 [Paxillus rubicundulus Ve08.2h10]